MNIQKSALDKAARAIFEAEHNGVYAGLDWEQLSPHLRSVCQNYARAAIEAYAEAVRDEGSARPRRGVGQARS